MTERVHKLYRYQWCDWASPGYVVYRCIRDSTETVESLNALIRVHKVAYFVTEGEAADYCEYRNIAMVMFGTDSVKKTMHARREIL